MRFTGTQVRDLRMYQLPEAGNTLPQTVVYGGQSGLQARSLKPSSWQTQFLLEDLRRSCRSFDSGLPAVCRALDGGASLRLSLCLHIAFSPLCEAKPTTELMFKVRGIRMVVLFLLTERPKVRWSHRRD